jgi:hypothetical protein
MPTGRRVRVEPNETTEKTWASSNIEIIPYAVFNLKREPTYANWQESGGGAK